MTHYRLKDIDLSTRIELGLGMRNPSRAWGEASALAKKYGVSRKFLYQLGDQVGEALGAALRPKQAGRKPKVESSTIDQAFLCRAILILAMVVPGTVRAIQLVLELLFGQHKSVGVISETLQAFGEAAQHYNATLRTTMPVLGEADEIFQGKQPCLTVVDGRSFLVLNLSAEQSRLLHKGHRVTRRLEADAYQAIERTEKAERAEHKSSSSRRHTRSGRMSCAKAQAKECQAIELFDCWCWLFGEIRQALCPFNAEGERRTVAQTRHEPRKNEASPQPEASGRSGESFCHD